MLREWKQGRETFIFSLPQGRVHVASSIVYQTTHVMFNVHSMYHIFSINFSRGQERETFIFSLHQYRVCVASTIVYLTTRVVLNFHSMYHILGVTYPSGQSSSEIRPAWSRISTWTLNFFKMKKIESGVKWDEIFNEAWSENEPGEKQSYQPLPLLDPLPPDPRVVDQSASLLVQEW